ncbi:VTT domain-containing protein [Candidatus Bathyarchaeota archaeon]|nr:VTT domain-containing protein [Candidatus Bathyarchaeota archaeon]
MSGLLGSLSTLGYFGVLVSSLILNLIPFVGPSNIVIAGAAGSMFPSLNPFLIGFFIALGASAAKTIHFGISFFAGNFLKRKIKTGKNENESKPISHRYAMIALFLAAATPIPDDPVVISLGLARYSPLRFFLAFFTGKALITIAGAFFGHRFGLTLEKYFGLEGTIIISIVLTIVLTIAIIKKDTILKKFKLFQRSKSQ